MKGGCRYNAVNLDLDLAYFGTDSTQQYSDISPV